MDRVRPGRRVTARALSREHFGGHCANPAGQEVCQLRLRKATTVTPAV
jgi:hypothetical protein